MKQIHLRTIQIAVIAESEGEADDVLSESLRPMLIISGNEESPILDWQYSTKFSSNVRPLIENYEEGQAFVD